MEKLSPAIHNAQNAQSEHDQVLAQEESRRILYDTVNELKGDITREEYILSAEQLGLPAEYYDWHGGSGVKSFNKDKLVEDAAKYKQDRQSVDSSDDVVHNEQQASYDALLDGMSNDDIARRAEAGGYKKRVAEHNQKHDQEQADKVATRQAEQKIITSENLQKLGVAELADMLGQKPNYQKSKADYIKELEAEKVALVNREQPKIDMATRTSGATVSQAKTVEALRNHQSGDVTFSTSKDRPKDSKKNTQKDASDDTPKIELSEHHTKAIEAAEEKIAKAREAYIEISAKRRKLSFGLRRKNRNSAVVDAKQTYEEALADAAKITKEAFDTEGVSNAELLALAKIAGAKESEELNINGLQAKQEELANTKFMTSFNNWWTRQTAIKEDGSKPRFGKFKKIAAMATIGLTVGVVAGTTLSVAGVGLAGASLPGVLAYRFTKGQAVSRISQNADAATQAKVHNEAAHIATQNSIDNATSIDEINWNITGVSQEKTEEYITKNRKRLGKAALVGTVFGVAGSMGSELFSGSVGGIVENEGSVNSNSLLGKIATAKGWLQSRIETLSDSNGPEKSSTGTTVGGSESTSTTDISTETAASSELASSAADNLPTQEQIDAINEALDSRTADLMSTEGDNPWTKASEAYGSDATARLIQAVESLQEQGVDAEWSADPMTSQNAYIMINGQSATGDIWPALAAALAEQDLENYFEDTE